MHMYSQGHCVENSFITDVCLDSLWATIEHMPNSISKPKKIWIFLKKLLSLQGIKKGEYSTIFEI